MNNETRNISIEVEGKVFWVDIDKPMTIKELAYFLKRNRAYISAMRQSGFTMPRDPILRQCTSTLSQAYHWLTDNPDFTYAAVYKKTAPKMTAKKNNAELSNRADHEKGRE